MTDLLPVRSDLCHGPSCTEKITEASPSQDFHSADCQQRWHERWAFVPVDQDVEPTASGMEPSSLTQLEWEEILRSLAREGHTFTLDTTPITMAAPVELHDQMHDTLDSIAAILEQYREVNERG